MNQTVSVILPTYNGASRIERSINSVFHQNFSKWELIIIDDGSTDGTEALISALQKKDSRIAYIKNEVNVGIQKSLNKGLRAAQGGYVARIDDDDEWIDPDKLAKQVEFLGNNPEYALVGTNAIIFNENGQELGRYSMPQDDHSIRARMLIKNCFIHPSILVRREAVVRAGGYSESEMIKHIEDYELWLRLGCIGKLANINSVSVRLTVHSTSLTFQNRLVQAKRMMAVSRQYRKKYPHFLTGQIILMLRIVGFMVLEYVPLPNTSLYKIQKLYKKL